MAANKMQKTIGDYVAIALSPALIMALVGSLVYYLIEILYRGQYTFHLQWVMACFVFAAVLIARVAMQAESESRAAFYGIALAIAVGLALFKFVEYPPDAPLANVGWFVNMALVGLIWWCAHKLTWDCTLIDDSEDASGEGLLDAAGLSDRPAPRALHAPVDSAHAEDRAEAEAEAAASPNANWWERYQAWKQKRRERPHTPGVWVVYFSLAALPLFGLGQLTVPPGNMASRKYVFWLLAIYVTSGLALLLTTSFLGLRKYLRQRKVQMPLPVVTTWLLLGGGLILALVVVAAIVPRPDPEYALFRLSGLPGSKDRDGSRYAISRRDAGKGQGRGSQDKQGDKDAQDGQGQQRDKQGSREAPGKQGEGNQGQPQRQGDQGQRGQGQGNQRGNRPEDKQGKQGEQRKPGEKGPESKDRGNREQDQEQEGSESENEEGSSGRNFDSFEAPELGVLGSLLKWIVVAIVGLVALYFVIRFLANFTSWARGFLDWWHGLFTGWGGKRATEEEIHDVVPETPPPFSDFTNPFTSGAVPNRSPNELVRYTFAALQSWAWEQRMERKPHETPIEFAERVAGLVKPLEREAPPLAEGYSRVVYARQTLDRQSLPLLQRVWQVMSAPAATRAELTVPEVAAREPE